MGFEIAEIAAGIDFDARLAGKPGAGKRIAQADALAASARRRSRFRLRRPVNERLPSILP
jgi:hypothetical protein